MLGELAELDLSEAHVRVNSLLECCEALKKLEKLRMNARSVSHFGVVIGKKGDISEEGW